MWQQAIGGMVVPGVHQVAGQLDAVGGFEFPLLAVEGAVVAELLGEHAAGDQAGGERWSERDGIHLVFAHVGEPLDDLQGEGGRFDVETLAGLSTSLRRSPSMSFGPLKVSMAAGSGEMAEQGGKETDLLGIRGADDGSRG